MHKQACALQNCIGKAMDFLTGMAYWGIIVLVVVNALIVSRMKVVIHDDESANDSRERDHPE